MINQIKIKYDIKDGKGYIKKYGYYDILEYEGEY